MAFHSFDLPSEYYAHLASCRKLPTTSQPSPELFEKFYLEAAAAGDEVLGIFLSHELSGTWQFSCKELSAHHSISDCPVAHISTSYNYNSLI